MFRRLGVGNKTYEDTVATEMAQLSAAIRETKGTPFDPNVLFGQAIANIICSIILGTQYKYDDAEFRYVSFLFLFAYYNKNMFICHLCG